MAYHLSEERGVTLDLSDVNERILSGTLFRSSMLASAADSMSRKPWTQFKELVSDFQRQVSIVHQGAFNPILLARQLVKIGGEKPSATLFIWDDVQSIDYVIRIQDGLIVWASSSNYWSEIESALHRENISAANLKLTNYPSAHNVEQLSQLLGDKVRARSFVYGVALRAVFSALGTAKGGLAWGGGRDSENDLAVPLGDFIVRGLETSSDRESLRATIKQLGTHVVFTEKEQATNFLPSKVQHSNWERGVPVQTELFLRQLADEIGESDQSAKVLAAALVFTIAGCIKPSKSDAVSRQPARARPKTYFDALGVDRETTVEEIETAYNHKLKALFEMGLEDSRQKAEMKVLLGARTVLSEPLIRQAYEQSSEAKVAFVATELEEKLVGEHFRRAGERALNRRSYEEANEAFKNALLFQQYQELNALCVWAEFLGGEQTAEKGNAAIQQLTDQVGQESLDEMTLVYLGKIARLSGDSDRAKAYLQRALDSNKDLQVAWQELRQINAKTEIRRGVTLVQSLSEDGSTQPIWLYTVACLVLLYAGANLMPSDRSTWPMTGQNSAALKNSNKPQSRDEVGNALRRSQLLEDGSGPRPMRARGLDRTIPQNKRVAGNVEYYHIPDDFWFWSRRIGLLILGIVGLIIFRLKDPTYLWGEESKLSILSIVVPYGAIVGFLTSVPTVSSDFLMLFLMGLSTVIAEQTFFFAFLGRAFLARVNNAPIALAQAVLAFGLYQLTFFATIDMESKALMMSGILQVTMFVGGASALAMYRAKTIFVSVGLHLAVQTLIMLKYSGIL